MSRTAHEVESQPRVWPLAAEAAARAADRFPAAGSRVAFLGCGTSYYVAQAVAALWERAGRGEADAFPASEVPAGRRYDRVVAISRSGTTTEVVRALEELRPGTRTLAICAAADTVIARLAGQSIILGFADEESVVQTRFATSVLALFRAHLADDVGALGRQASAALADPLPDELTDADRFVFLASGWGVGLANEAALKVREAAGAFSEAYPAMEYRHGPLSATTPGTLVWVLGSIEAGVIASALAAGGSVVDSGRDPMVELVLIQRAAIALAADRGLDPDHPRHLSRSVILE